MKKCILITITICALSLNIGMAVAWHDETHLAIARAAGYAKWYNAAGADLAKEKAGLQESLNHYSNNYNVDKITPELVLEQVKRYNDAADKGGHLYGAIIGSLRAYAKSRKDGKYAQYHIAYCAHYLADLTQPQHNTPLDEFSRAHHVANDGIVENKALQRIGRIEKYMYPITLRSEFFEEDLAKEIARIANLTRELDRTSRQENRNLTPEEAYRQLGHSASLFEAVLNHLGL